MKFVIASTAVIAAALTDGATPALAKPGPEVEISNAVARVVVIVEDRSDVGVEIDQGTSGLPALRVERRGNEIRIDGGLSRASRAASRTGIPNCHSGPSNAARPGDGATVEVRDWDASTWRRPPDRHPGAAGRERRASGAVFGSIGRGARSVELGNGGCGDWDVANTDGTLDLSLGGSGDVRTGTSAVAGVPRWAVGHDPGRGYPGDLDLSSADPARPGSPA